MDKTKKIFVSFLLVASVLIFASALVSATSQLGNINSVEVNSINVANNPAIVAGNTITVKVQFTSNVSASDVVVRATLEGNNESVAKTSSFDIESGYEYSKVLTMQVPFNLQDKLSGTTTLDIKISANGYVTDQSYDLRVQRQSYDANIMSINVPQTITAGNYVPVNVVLKNLGYNNLNDLYLTASIPALGVQQEGYFGDLVALRCNDKATSLENYGVNITRMCNENDQNTLNGNILLQIPYNVQPGVYTLQVTAKNSDTTSSGTIQVAIGNPLASGNFIVSGNQLLIVNPTNEIAVYRIVPASTSDTTVTASDSIVSVPAGSSKIVTTSATSSTSGAKTYSVNVFDANGNLAYTADFVQTVSGTTGAASPIVVLTIILAIIFVVLLVVLIVLIGRKPEKAEEFGESYY